MHSAASHAAHRPRPSPRREPRGLGKLPGGRGERSRLDFPSQVLTMVDLKQAIPEVADFPRPGILFRDISPLLRDHFAATVQALDALLTDEEWSDIDAVAGIESRGF